MIAPRRLWLTVVAAAAVLCSCMETAPVPGWVQICADTQGGPECAPDDVTHDDDEVGPGPG